MVALPVLVLCRLCGGACVGWRESGQGIEHCADRRVGHNSSVAEYDCGNSSVAVVGARDEICCCAIGLDVDLMPADFVATQSVLQAEAMRAPSGREDGYVVPSH
jgi:hypothetical protein